ncbi:P-type conjugative transfer protein TrbL [Sphingomonas sp. Leaf230]|uniref:P-type conjugative transfer protein TrbL n=1 Tax=Sphingomonas sp. Leaf230 TaxID=1735694 RepID=UPI0009E904FB|nr:P-type conjugative transfer protein TrbL [Sphingomonas sp. Leaf230]
MLSRNVARTISASLLIWFLSAGTAFAQSAPSNGMLDNVLNKFKAQASGWGDVFTHHATVLFWSLAAISMIWTFGQMALKRVDLGEFASELIRFAIFCGFYWWLLLNGPAIGLAIINGMRQMGAEASGLPNNLSPSGIVDVGFDIYKKILANTSAWHPMDSLVGMLCGIGILVTLALVGVNMLLLLASAYILAYAGVIFLGFGGSRWTSDMAINYFKTVLAVGASLLTMVVIVGVGKTFLDQYYETAGNSLSLQDTGTMLVFCVVLLALVNKIPAMVAGVITGGSIGAIGSAGSFGAGAAMGAASMAAAAAATGGAAMAAGAANAVGGGQAIAAAYKSAQADMADTGAGSALTSATDAAAPSDGGGSPGGGGSPMEAAMGSTSSSSSSSPMSSNDNGSAATGGEAASDTGSQSASAAGGSSAGGGGAGGGGAGGGGGANAADAARNEPGGGEGGGSEAGGAGAGGSASGAAAGAAGAAAGGSAAWGAAKILGKNAAGMVGEALQGRVDRSAMGKLSSRIQAASAAANPPASPGAAPTEAAQSNPEPLASASGPSNSANSGSAPAGGSDGGALDGDGGPSEAIGADPGGFGGDAISGSSRRDNPSSAAGEVDDFVNRGRAHDAG